MPTRPTVLVVDDDPDVRGLIREYLTENGYDVVEAGGGRRHAGFSRSECRTSCCWTWGYLARTG